MGRNAFDTAVEVVADGFTGAAGVAEWMARIQSLGQRYCALALDIILASDVEVSSAPLEQAAVAVDLEQSYDPLFEGMFVFDGVPGEPVEY